MKLSSKFALAAAGLCAAFIGGKYVYSQVYDYSDGDRNITAPKLSYKGSLCKSWEGEGALLAPSNIDGQGVTTTFKFSVPEGNKGVIKKIKDAESNPGVILKLTYRQVKWYVSCMHDTQYLIENAEVVGKTDPMAPMIVTTPNIGTGLVRPRR